MKKCGLKTNPMTSRCLYRSGEDTCLFSGSCRYLQDPPKERAKQDCLTCDHKIVCKYKEKFEAMTKEHFPLLCVCQWYKKENQL